MIAAVSIATVLAACGSGNSGGEGRVVAIDCAWLQGNNCWKAVVSAVAACAPVEPAAGTFSADRKACQYASGETVRFAASVANPPRPPFNFSIGTCVTVEESDASETVVRVSSRAGVAKLEEKTASHSLEVTCPDGSLNIADLSASSPLIGCNRAEALLPDTYLASDSYDPEGTSYSFLFRGAEGPPAQFHSTVWSCR